MAMYSMHYSNTMEIKLAPKNRKIEVLAFNLLPGSASLKKKDGTVLSDLKGTCSGCCEGVCEGFNKCYACRDAIHHHNSVIPRLMENTLVAYNDLKKLFVQLQRELDKYPESKPFRPHSSGEYFSYEYFVAMNKLAERNPNRQFYDYTKRFEFIERYLKEYGSFPKNFAHNMSIWHGNYANPIGLQEFVYDDHTDPKVMHLPHCPSVNYDGSRNHNIKCGKNCFRCINRKDGQKTAVHAH